MLIVCIFISKFPFSILLISNASSITLSRCLAEFIIISKYFLFSPLLPIACMSIFVKGIIELRGVRSSCATDEKNSDLSLVDMDSKCLILVM